MRSFFKRASVLIAGRFVVEVRNKDWLDSRLTDLLREHNVGLALTDAYALILDESPSKSARASGKLRASDAAETNGATSILRIRGLSTLDWAQPQCSPDVQRRFWIIVAVGTPDGS